MPPVYLAHTNQAVFVGPTGHQHIRSTSPDDERPTVINCVECEKYLVRDHGAVYSPDQVPLTEKQLERKDREQRDGNAAVAEAAKALAANARAQLAPAAAGDDIDARIATAVAAALAMQSTPRKRAPRKAAG